MAQSLPSTIDAQIGNVTGGGQVAVGSHILQIGRVEGGLVIRTDQKPAPPTLRQQPIKVLPKRFAGMLDRQAETETLVKTIQANESIEFNGEPGSGKTSLLRHLAHLPQVDSFQSGVIYLQVNGLSPSDLAQSLFEAFYEYDSPTKPTEMELRRSLQQVNGLLLLDDAEMTREQIEQLMNLAPNCVFVTASTERTLAGETQAISLKGLPTADAVTMFQRELGRTLSDEELFATSRLCESLKCHPRSVLRAATQAREDNRPLMEIIAQQVNASPSEAAPAQIKQLSEEEKKVLTALAVFRGAPVQVEHVATVAGLIDVDKEIENLERKGLVESHDDRYSLAGDVDVALLGNLSGSFARALIHFTDWAERNRSKPETIAKAALPILLILKWGLAARAWPEIIRLAHATEQALSLSGRWDLWATTLGTVLEAARAQSNRAEEAWALHQLGTRALCLEENATAETDLRQALSIREALGDTRGAAVTRHNLNLLLHPAPPDSNGDRDAGGGVGAGGTTVPLMLKIAAPVLLALLGGAAAWWFFSKPPLVAASIVSFSATPTTVASNGQAQLCYEVSNANTVNIAPGIGQRTATKECIPISPRETTTYTLTVAGTDKKSTSKELTIVVEQPRVLAEILRFEILRRSASGNPNDVSFQLCYGTRNAAHVEIDNGIGEVPEAQQRCVPINPAQTTTYTLSVKDAGGQTLTRQATVDISKPPPLPPQILSFDASDPRVQAGKVLRLCYELVDVTSARIEPDVGEVKVGAGRQCVSAAPKDNTEYVLTAVNAEGKSVNKKAAVVVMQPPATIVSFTAQPDKVIEEGQVKLCYEVQNAKSLRMSGRSGPVTPVDSGCVGVTVSETMTYTLSATGLDGSVTDKSVTITVNERQLRHARILDFTVSSGRIKQGERVKLCYGVVDAETVSLSPVTRSAPVLQKHCLDHAPRSTTTYTLIAIGEDRRPESRELTVEVEREQVVPAVKITRFEIKRRILGGPQLCYAMENARSARIEPDFNDVKLPGDCLTIRAREARTYTLTATGNDGKIDQRSVNYTPPEQPKQTITIIRFSARPQTIRAGARAELCYSTTTGEGTMHISPGIGAVEPNVFKCVPVAPKQTTTYTLTVIGPDGKRQSSRAVTITVQQPVIQ